MSVIDQVRARIGDPGERHRMLRIVAVANQKGGVGKTTLTMQLAAVLSRRLRVLVVDVDPQGSTLWWADNAGGSLPFDFAGSQRAGVLAQLRLLDDAYDVVLVDTPGSLEDTSILETVLDASDFVVVPMVPEPLAVEPTMRTLTRLIEPRHLQHAVVLNRIDARVPNQLHTWQELTDTTFGVPRFDAHLRQYKAHAVAPVLGQLVTTISDNQRTAGAIADVTRLGFELIERLVPATAEGLW